MCRLKEEILIVEDLFLYVGVGKKSHFMWKFSHFELEIIVQKLTLRKIKFVDFTI